MFNIVDSILEPSHTSHHIQSEEAVFRVQAALLRLIFSNTYFQQNLITLLAKTIEILLLTVSGEWLSTENFWCEPDFDHKISDEAVTLHGSDFNNRFVGIWNNRVRNGRSKSLRSVEKRIEIVELKQKMTN